MNSQETFLVVGIGASAGGIEALEGFFQGVPREPDAAFIIVTHLSPDRESLLHQVIARFTSMPVAVATDGALIQPGHVYVMPEASALSARDGRLVLAPVVDRRDRKPADTLLASLATAYGERAAGVVLSGGDGDGTLGLKAIKERGGITMAQLPDGHGPRHPSMPATAIASGFADFAVPVDAMGHRLLELARASGGLDAIASAQTTVGDDPIAEGGRQLHEIYGLLRGQIGHDFSGYKTRTFIRRVERRMQVTDSRNMAAYIARLRIDAQEVNALFRDLLINVTHFFRDTEAFEALAQKVIPTLFADRSSNEVIRIWVPGCATGEEVYSLAILIREFLGNRTDAPKVQIFATDIDDRSLAVARAGRYPAPLLDTVSAERRERFFYQDGESWVVARDVRDLCIFSPHSVIRDPPFSRIDLVSCRNLLIYFGSDAQNQVIPVFHYALRPGGFLFLGSAENVTQFDDLFEPVEKRHRIFRRRPDSSANLRLPAVLAHIHGGQTTSAVRRPEPGGLMLRQTVDQHVLERFAPAHVVVNRDGDVVYYSTRTGKYLEPPAGAPTRQLMTMARRGLRLDLRTLFRECVESGRPAERAGIAVELEDGRIQVLAIHVEPLHGSTPGGEPMYLILFVDQPGTLSREEALARLDDGIGNAAHAERELRDTRDRLQSMIEEYETALEELKSSNEELVSVNEEMQSTNEELEASKEELQSVNEELHTVNTELHGKIDALDQANSDLMNLFDSTNVATVFLDRDLVIRSYTPAVSTIFSVRGSDRGRPITDLATQLVLPTLTDDIARVFRYHEAIERRAFSEDRRSHYLVRLAPYQGSDARVEGVVATFLDVTTMTRSEAHQRMLIAELQHRTRNLLTIVETIARRTMTGAPGLDDFAVRLGALSRVQGLVGGQLSEAIDLGAIVRLEMQAHSIPEGKITVSGPKVPLGYDVAQTLCLALHELTTNAVKYGALRKDSEGTLEVSWRLLGEDEVRLSFDWIERGVRVPVGEPASAGFGRELIEQALAFSLRAKSSWRLEVEGVRCHLDVPMAGLGANP